MDKHPPTKCPKCRAESAHTDCDEVDVGIGVITGNHCYECPTHGEFCFHHSGETFWRDEKNLAELSKESTLT